MTTAYPAALDTLTNPSASTSRVTLSHAGQHANANDAIEAIQAKLGVGAAAVLNGAPALNTPWIAAKSQNTDTAGANAPFQLVIGGIAGNGGRFDPSMTIGYNAGDGGVRPNLTEPRLVFNIEADWDLNGSSRQMEAYWDYLSADGLTNIRPLMVTVDRATHAVVWEFRGGTYNFEMTDGVSRFGINTTNVWVTGVTGQDTAFRVKAAASRTSSVLLGYGGTDDTMAIGTDSATIGHVNVGSLSAIRIYSAPMSGAGIAMHFGSGTASNAAVGTFAVSANVGLMALVAVGKSGQAVSILEVQDSTAAVLSRFDKNGVFMTRKIAAPADGDLVASELALWFDSTNGAGKAMFKGKTANGTVVTASVALA